MGSIREEKGVFNLVPESEFGNKVFSNPTRGTIYLTDSELICGDSGKGMLYVTILGSISDLLLGIPRMIGLYNPQSVPLESVDQNEGTFRLSLSDITGVKLQKGSFGAAITVHSESIEGDDDLLIRLGTRGRNMRGTDYHREFAEEIEQVAKEAGADITTLSEIEMDNG